MPRISILGEQGVSGLVRFNGLVSESYTSKLEWPACYDVYNEMRRRDPTIRTIWNALVLLARTAQWYVEPGEDSEAGREAAAFVEDCIHDMAHTIEDYVEDALTCVPFGWSWLELVYKRRDDGRIGWKKWATRRQSSFERWQFDAEGGVQGLVQRPAPDYGELTIPIEKSLHFTSQRDGGNPEGLALFENLYEPWYYLKNLQIINGIGWQRTFVGLPVFEFEEKPGNEDKAAVQEVGQGLQVDEKQYVSVPAGVTFHLESASNAGASALLETIQYYRLLMMQTLLADFINLGTGQTGSWALGSDKSQLFLMAVDGFLDRIAGVINRFAVRRLMELNPGAAGMETRPTAWPRVTHTKVEKPALGQLGNWLQQVEPLIAWTPEDETWLRKRGGLPVVQGSGERETRERDEDEPSGLAASAGSGDPAGAGGRLIELEASRDEERGKLERGLARDVRGFLDEQEERVVERAAAVGADIGDDAVFWEAETTQFRQSFLRRLLKVITSLVDFAIDDLMAQVGGGADWAAVNAEAAEWARRYSGKMITDVTETTRRSVREAVASWIESGGELEDLTEALEPMFGERRANLIATTEVTRAYDEANNLARQKIGLPGAMKRAPAHPSCRCNTREELLPNGEWVVIWLTANDDLVCKQPIETPWGPVVGCSGLQGMVVSENYGGQMLSDVKASVS